MGKAFVVFKLYPEEPGTEDIIQKKIKEVVKGEVKDIQVTPIGFGLNVIRVGIVFEDNMNPNDAEDALRSITEIKEVEAEQTTLL